MQLKLTVRTVNDIVVVDCAGRIVFGEESADLRDTVKMVITQSKRVVLNLSGVTYIDSGGLGTLVGTLASTRNRHGEIKLVRPNQRVTELLLRTRLNTVFKSYESDDEAVAAFHASKPPSYDSNA
jgi:anti-sigma B factor antagonist